MQKTDEPFDDGQAAEEAAHDGKGRSGTGAAFVEISFIDKHE